MLCDSCGEDVLRSRLVSQLARPFKLRVVLLDALGGSRQCRCP